METVKVVHSKFIKYPVVYHTVAFDDLDELLLYKEIKQCKSLVIKSGIKINKDQIKEMRKYFNDDQTIGKTYLSSNSIKVNNIKIFINGVILIIRVKNIKQSMLELKGILKQIKDNGFVDANADISLDEATA